MSRRGNLPACEAGRSGPARPVWPRPYLRGWDTAGTAVSERRAARPGDGFAGASRVRAGNQGGPQRSQELQLGRAQHFGYAVRVPNDCAQSDAPSLPWNVWFPR